MSLSSDRLYGADSIKIVLFAYSFPPSIGGGEQYNYNLAHELTLRGINVNVVTSVPATDKDSYEFSVKRVRNSLLLTPVDIFSYIRKYNPDIVHISGPTPFDYILLPLLKFSKKHVIMTYHADFPSKLGRLFNSFIFMFQSCMDVILVQTESDKSKLINRSVKLGKLKKLIFSGINKDLFKLYGDNAERDIDIVFVGRMDRAHSYKGYFELLNIISHLKKILGSQPVIQIVGGGTDLPIFLGKARKNNIELNVRENVDDQELVAILNRSKALILPSINDSEGFGRVALEAIFCGCVPIVSKHAGVSEIIKEFHCGVIIDPINSEGSANKIANLLTNKDQLDNLQKIGRTIINLGKFTAAWSAQETLNIYYKILDTYK